MSTDSTPEKNPSPETVRATLRALALGEEPDTSPDVDRSALVDESEAALSSVLRAAAFAESGGFQRLRAVAESACRDGATDTHARRAKTVLDTVEQYQAAYREVDADASDHFHSAHDSPIPDGTVLSDNR